MSLLNRFFALRWAVVLAGAVTGILAPILVYLGNPGNMGFCTACFLRDMAGALGLHRAEAVQYVRPEIIGVVLGATLGAVLFGEFKPRTGSAPIMRFLLGMLGMIGALVFLGCTWRVYLCLGGGDWNAILRAIPGVRLFGPCDPARQVAVVSFALAGLHVSDIALQLDEEHGILCRPGLHCAPAAHRALGSFPEGTVRFSPGPFTTSQEVEAALKAIAQLARAST